MTEYITIIIAVLGGNAALLLAVTWLLQKIIGQQLTKDLEHYKADLKTLTYEHEVEFRQRHDVVTLQKYQYFFPFQSSANELMGRLLHIDDRLSNPDDKQNYENMVRRFQQDFESQDREWYFNDAVGPEGGYFMTSTIYMNCVLFYWIHRIQLEYPFIPLLIGELDHHIQTRYRQYCLDDPLLSVLEHECHIYDLVKNIKVAISRKHGIPYGLHTSLGDYVFNHTEKRVMNYAEFCEELHGKETRIKYRPLIQFWSGIVPPSEPVAQERLQKIKTVILLLEHLNKASIKEG